MLGRTYEKLKLLSYQYHGYICTEDLIKEGFTNRQIYNFVCDGMLEKICYGQYWLSCAAYSKPGNYKLIEVSRCNPKAIICADSACYCLGLIDVEPDKLSVATRRTDRGKLNMNFPVTRHYISERLFEESFNTVQTEFGIYNVYDIHRSVCDCIRFKKDIDTYIFQLVIDNYRIKQDQQKKRLLEYAKWMRLVDQVEKYL